MAPSFKIKLLDVILNINENFSPISDCLKNSEPHCPISDILIEAQSDIALYGYRNKCPLVPTYKDIDIAESDIGRNFFGFFNVYVLVSL
jgi:hypothetical protein